MHRVNETYDYLDGIGKTMRKRVWVVGGGPSLKGFDFSMLDNEDTIAVNESIFKLNDPTYFISVDYDWLHRIKKNEKRKYKRFKKSEAKKFIVCNMAKGSRLVFKNGVFSHYGIEYDLTDYDEVIISTRQAIFGTMRDFAHLENSGGCALQLAIALHYQEIYLLGIDLSKDRDNNTHYHDAYDGIERPVNYYTKKFDLFFNTFYRSIKQYKNIGGYSKIFSCSNESRLNCVLEYKTPLEAINGIH